MFTNKDTKSIDQARKNNYKLMKDNQNQLEFMQDMYQNSIYQPVLITTC